MVYKLRLYSSKKILFLCYFVNFNTSINCLTTRLTKTTYVNFIDCLCSIVLETFIG